MKNKILALLAISGLLIAAHLGAAVADSEKTVTGEGACAKCILKTAPECQLTVTADEGGKQVTYYLTENKVAKDFGKQVCAEKKRIKVTGTARTVDGKQVIVPTKIELAKA